MSKVVETVKMDSRKFLGQLNDSAQAKVAFFEEHVKAMGNEAGKSWRLAALHARELYIEDADTNTYYVAEHSRDHGKVTINNIRPLQIVEGEKQELFLESAYRLVSAIEANNQKEMAVAFNRLKNQRFSSRVVPESGLVRCRDGVSRRINISNGESLDENIKDRLVACIVESLKDKVIVENGSVVAGYFGDDEIKLPVTKWATRKLVAKRMAESAKNAYWSQGFQSRIYTTAKLISDNKIEEAVSGISKFLDEMEEFTLLTRAQTKTLIENALAAKAVFNQQLCDDTATLFYRTNMKINKPKIVEEWKNISRKSEHPVLAENVNVLENSKNFEATYDKFLKLIFETISNREVAAEALATTLNVLRSKTPKIRESHELSSKLFGLINRLKQRDFDDAAIYEAEDLIATIQEELGATETLGNFDQIPGDTPGMDPTGGGAIDTGAGGGAPVININSPLIQIGGSSAGGPAGADAAAAPPPGGDPELEALLGQGGQQPPPGGAPAPGGMPPGGAPAPGGMGGMPAAGAAPIMQGRQRTGKAIKEGVPPWQAGRGNPKDKPWRDDHPSEFEGFEKHDSDDDCDDDCDDPYKIKKDEKVAAEGLRFTDYGAPVITDDGDLDKIIRIMQRLATEHKLVGKALSENLEKMAKATIASIGLRIPEGKLHGAVEQIVTAFVEEWKKPWLKDEEGDDENDEGDEEGDEEGVAENQFKTPIIRPRGFGRSSVGNTGPKGRAASEGRINVKKAIAEGIIWGQEQKDAILGEMAGVRFLFDHGGDSELEPVILSEDGAVEIPIPKDLFEDAFAAAKMTNGDGSRFISWLAGSLEQLRPISMAEDRALEEAVAKITAGPDGSLSVEVTPDVNVDELADDGMGGGEMDGGEMDGGMGNDDGMAPVDATDPNASAPTPPADPGMDNEESMPDFEAGGNDSMGGQPAPAAPAPSAPAPSAPKQNNAQPEEDDGLHFEDRDFTAPSSSKYTAPLKDNKRKMPDAKMPGKSTDKLDGIGPDLKTDDGSGVNPPTAKKGSDD